MIHDVPTVFSGCQQRSRVAHLEEKPAAASNSVEMAKLVCLDRQVKNVRNILKNIIMQSKNVTQMTKSTLFPSEISVELLSCYETKLCNFCVPS